MPVVTTVTARQENSPQELVFDGTDVVLVRRRGSDCAGGA